jgi:glycosyltransferase involved in cell wall biosynthesis
MRILLVNDYGTIDGGAEVIVLALRDALRARGHDVRWFTSSAGADVRELHADTTCFGTKSSFRTAVQCLNVPAARRLREVLHSFRPDVIHVNLYLTQLSPWILREFGDIPAIYYAQWYRAICPLGTRRLPSGETCQQRAGTACLRSGCLPPWDGPLMWLQLQLDTAWGNRFTKVTAISQAVARRLRQFGAPHLANSTVIYPGTPVVSARTEMAAEPLVLAAGRFVPEKGFDILIRAFAAIAGKLPEARLILLGDGPLRNSLQRLTDQLGVHDRVEFPGHRSHDETMQWIRSAWVTCVPSLWEEPLGMISVEAQMRGVAVLASAAGGLVETLADGETGLLVPPGDVGALSEALDTLLGDRERTWKWGQQGHSRARELFGLDLAAARFEAFYEQTIAARGQPPGRDTP